MNSRVTDPAARRQLQLGNPIGAADIYRERAAKSKDPIEQQDFWLLAAEILFDRSLAAEGEAQLALIPSELASPELLQRRAILQAKALIYNGEATQGLNALPIASDVVSTFHRARVYETQAQAYNMLQDPDNELIARINLEDQISDPTIIERSHQRIWQLLTTQPLSTLRRMTTNVRGDVYQGWIELALAQASAGVDSAKRITAIEDWQSRFSNHPANPYFVSTLYSDTGFYAPSESVAINQVGVLLPLSGTNTANVAAAIRDGIIAAHDDAKKRQTTPTLRFYDIGNNPGYARNAYQTAVQDGADLIIGPLRKDAVAAVISQRELPVPTITLNTVAIPGLSNQQNNVIQFGLSPEDEARAAAARATALSLKSAIVLQADDSRGDREAQAFQDTLMLYGGEVKHLAILPKDQYDYSEQIREALAIDDSDNRFRALSRTIGEKLFFEPSIRNDVDVVFLALTSDQARSVRPQLDFFHARGLTRLATSRVAAIDDDEKRNKDLNTIFYTDAPWVLRDSLDSDPLKQSILSTFSGADGIFGKLYALGADAYRIMENLDNINAGEKMQGFTGELVLNEDGVLQRHLDWAQYVDGVSTNVETLQAPELPSIRSTTPESSFPVN